MVQRKPLLFMPAPPHIIINSITWVQHSFAANAKYFNIYRFYFSRCPTVNFFPI